MGCGGSRHQTEIEGIPIRLHHQRNNMYNDQNKPCMEEESVKSYITSEESSSTPKFKFNERLDIEERDVEGSHNHQDYEDEDDRRMICSSSPSFKIYLPENHGQDKEDKEGGDGDGGNNINGGQYVNHQFQETIEKEEEKKGILKKRISKYRIMWSKRWR